MLESVKQKPVIPSFEHFVGVVSVRLLSAANVDIDKIMTAVMEEIGERYGVDRVALRWIDLDQAVARPSAIWQRDPGVPVADNPLASTPWIIAETLRGNTVCIETPDDFPASAAIDREFVEAEGIKALFLTPLIVDDDLEGALTLSARDEFQWTDEIRTEVGSLAPIIAYAYWGNSTRAKLRHSEARYRAIVQDQTDLIVRWKPDGTIIWVNDFFCQHYQRPRDELVGRKQELFRAQDDWLGLIESIQDLTPQNPTLSGEYPRTLHSNSIVWEEWDDTGIFDNTGSLIEIQSVGRDVTTRKLAYDALRESETRYRDLVESSTDLIWESDLKLENFFSNRRLNTILGYPDGALQGASIDDVLHADDIKKLREDIPTLAAAGKGWQRRLLRSRHKDGNYRYLESTATPIFNDNSVVCGFRGVDRDVSGEYFAAEEIKGNEAIIKLLMESINDAVFSLGDDDTFIDCNSISLKMLGATKDMIIGKSPWDFSPPYQPDGRASMEKAKSLIRHAREGKSDRFDWVHTAVDGSTLYVDISLTAIETREGNRVFGILRDNTIMRQANRELQTALSQIKELRDQLQAENVYLRDEIRAAHGFDRIIGESSALKRVLAAIEQVAPTDITVLVTGETGTGKELVSQSIHDLSPRKKSPMISVNCAALSAELIESELFGHEKGAFTGANERRKGRFELADGGTLFLDEIGELSGELQAKLLRVIQEGEFERLGGSKTLQTDVRLIAATNRNLQRCVDEGEFRADLFYRINSFPIHVPPLREREGDIPLLTEFLVRKHADRLGKTISSISTRTLRYLQQQPWPGNIRELEGTIIRALISTTGPVLDYSENRPVATAPSSAGVSIAKSSLLDAQRIHIVEVLEQTRWVIEGERGAAAALGLAPSSLRSKMKRLDIVRPSP